MVCKNAKPKEKSYKLSDGDGLHLLVKPGGRDECLAARRELQAGRDPSISRKVNIDSMKNTFGKAVTGSGVIPRSGVPMRSNSKSGVANALTMKSVRLALRLSEEEAAAKAGTSSHTIANWEAGSVQPSFAELRDLAMALRVRMDDLVGPRPDRIPTSRYDISAALSGKPDATLDGWWGNVGVRYPQKSKSRWYPISMGEVSRIVDALDDVQSENEWLAIKTLNSRQLFLHPTAVEICLLDEGVGQPVEHWEVKGVSQTVKDWKIEEGDFQPFDPEVYSGLLDCFDEVSQERFEGSSPRFREMIQRLVAELKLAEKDRYFIHFAATHIYFLDGRVLSADIVPSDIADLLLLGSFEEEGMVVKLEDTDCISRYIPTHRIAGIDTPLLKVERHSQGRLALTSAPESA